MAGMTDIITFADEYSESTETDLDSNPFINRLFTGWMDRLYPATLEADLAADFNEKLTRDALVLFGKRHPKEFFVILDRYFVKKQYRKAVFRFLADYLQSQPPHLHQIMQTPLFGNILKCLQYDTSTTIVSAALTALIMLLPHMPSSLVPHLPTLFNIYARLLFWSREQPGAVESSSEDAAQTGNWEVCTFDPEVDDNQVSHLLNYYTMLYGLYPINFMDYIRKPQRYLRHASVANADDIEVQPTEIRDKSERFRRCHLLHPNFYSLTIESEKTDFGRWIKSEASEVVAECTGLCLVTELNSLISQNLPSITADTAPLVAENSVKEGQEPALLSSSSMIEPHEGGRISQSASMESIVSSKMAPIMARRGSQSSHPSTRDSLDTKNRDSGADSPTLPPHLVQSPSHTQLQDMIQSNKAIKSGLHQSLANDSVPSLALSHQGSVADRSAIPAISAPATMSSPPSLVDTFAPQIANLQRRILLLQNDLNFERYLKQQHMAHIGEMRRKKLEAATTEAEMQHILMTSRQWKNRFEEAKNAEMQVRRDSEKSRALAKKWEADLANKLKALRDESKRLKAELEKKSKELDNLTAERQKLRTLVCEAETKELNWKQNMQSIEIHAAEVDRLKSEVERLTIVEREGQSREVEQKMALNAAAEADSKAESLRLLLKAREGDIERIKKLYQSQVATLQSRLSESQEKGGGRRLNTKDIEAVEKALAGSRAKQAEMEKQYQLLSRKYTALQSSFLDFNVEEEAGKRKLELSNRRLESSNRKPSTANLTDEGADLLSMSTSPVMMKSRLHQVSSNTDADEGASTSDAWPMELKTGNSGSGAWSGTSAGTDGTGSVALSMSPGDKRLPTRSHSDLFSGGVQNRIRKDSKDKGKDEGSGKKDKKSSGLRGIRGFN